MARLRRRRQREGAVDGVSLAGALETVARSEHSDVGRESRDLASVPDGRRLILEGAFRGGRNRERVPVSDRTTLGGLTQFLTQFGSDTIRVFELSHWLANG